MKFVLDSSFIISLNTGNVLQDLFIWANTQQYSLYTTDLVAGELTKPPMSLLQGQGLITYPLSPHQLQQANQIAAQNSMVSLQDVSVIVVAQTLQACVLADDKPLRDLARQMATQIHGSLWALEQLVQHGQIAQYQACEAILRMLQGSRRLPSVEIHRIRKKFNC